MISLIHIKTSLTSHFLTNQPRHVHSRQRWSQLDTTWVNSLGFINGSTFLCTLISLGKITSICQWWKNIVLTALLLLWCIYIYTYMYYHIYDIYICMIYVSATHIINDIVNTMTCICIYSCIGTYFGMILLLECFWRCWCFWNVPTIYVVIFFLSLLGPS